MGDSSAKAPFIPRTREGKRDELSEAFAMAAWLHEGQFRKVTPSGAGGVSGSDDEATRIPYLTHLAEVVALMMQGGADKNQKIAGLLHDALEDQPCTPLGTSTEQLISETFDDVVLDYVRLCSDTVGTCVGGKPVAAAKPPWRQRKIAHIQQVDAEAAAGDGKFLLITLCDKLSNAQAIVSDAHYEGDSLWSRFNNEGDPRRTSWYYTMMLAVIQKHRGKLPAAAALIARLERQVDELALLADAAAQRQGLTDPLDLPASLEETLTWAPAR